jgi:hypothetical protein
MPTAFARLITGLPICHGLQENHIRRFEVKVKNPPLCAYATTLHKAVKAFKRRCSSIEDRRVALRFLIH